MESNANEEALLRSVTLQNARAVLLARERAERELLEAKEALERKNRELAAQHEWVRVTLASIGDAVITTDIDQRVTFLNPVAEAMTGWPLSEALGQPLERVFRIINELTRQPSANPIARVLREGSVVGLANHTALICRDGREIAIEDSAAPIRDGAGNVIGAVMVFHDVTERRHAEQVVEKTADRLRLALDAGQLGDWSWDPPSDAIILGPRGAHILGLPANTSITWTDLLQRLHEEDRERARMAVEEALTSKRDYEVEYRVPRSSGEWAWVLARGRGLYGPGGEVLAMIGVVVDITSRKRTEEVRSRLAAVVETSDDAIVSTTLDGIITTWNEGARKMYGFTAEEAIGKPVSIIIPPDRPNEEPAIIEKLLRGERVDHYETVRRCKDASLVDVSLSVSAVRDERGHTVAISKIARDITQAKRAAEHLQRSERQLRLITDAMPALVGYLDSSFRYRFANREYERWFQVSEKSIVGSRMPEILGDDAFARLRPFVERALRGERVEFEAEVNYRKVGPRSIHAFYIPDATDDGAVRGLFVLVLDVTDRKRSEEALRKAQEELSRHAETLERQVAERTAHLRESIESLESVCYTIAHDLRAPLRAVQGFTKVLLEDYAPKFDANGQQMAARIIAGATRMDALIRDLLQYARLSHIDLPCTNVNLQKIVERAKEELAPEIAAKKAEIETEGLPVVCGNATIAEQVFANLLSNSLKFVRNGVPAKIRIWSEPTQGGTRVFIRDNGIGIDPKYHHRLFGMFQRLHGDEKTYPGTGVGLAIVKKGMERMGGSVAVQSASGPGACFSVDFPGAKPE